MSSKYDSIQTAAELVSEVQLHGLSTAQEDICRAQDIFGHTPLEELARLANDIGRDNAQGEPDPNGTCSSGRRATQNTFYSILSNIWHWEEVTRFWNTYTNPQTEELKKRTMAYDAVAAGSKKIKAANDELEEKISYLAEDVKAEHDLRLAEISEKLKLKDEADRLRAKLHDRDMDVMELKAKLYDLLVERK